MTFQKSCSPVLLLLPATLLGMALLSACSSSEERPVYQGAQYYKNLEYPPDLSAPDTTDELRIPEPTKEAMQSFRDNNQLETTITPMTRSLALRGTPIQDCRLVVRDVRPRRRHSWT